MRMYFRVGVSGDNYYFFVGNYENQELGDADKIRIIDQTIRWLWVVKQFMQCELQIQIPTHVFNIMTAIVYSTLRYGIQVYMMSLLGAIWRFRLFPVEIDKSCFGGPLLLFWDKFTGVCRILTSRSVFVMPWTWKWHF